MRREHLSYDDLLKENAKLKQRLTELEGIDHLKELVKKNAQLNEYNEELKQTFEQIKVNQRKLEDSENRFKLLENNISDVIWMLDLHGDYTFISSSAVGMFGYLENEITGLKIKDLLTEKSYDQYQLKLSGILEKEEKSEITESFSLILEHKKKNGELFWAEISANPLRNGQGKFIGLAGISRDISERMKAENEIRKLSEVIEQSPTSIVITDLNGQINYVNSTFCRVTGYAPEEVIGKNPKILKSGMTSDSVYEDLWAAIYRGEVWRGEFINRKKNGETYWERAIIAPIKNHLNQVTNYVAIKENITAQKLAEQELIDSQQRYKLLSDISPEGLIIHENGLILDVSSSVSKITGFDMDELVGNQPVEKLFTMDSIEKIRQMVDDKYEFPYEVTGKRKDGSTFQAEVEARQFFYKGREVRVAALRDITYRKNVEKVLRSSLKMNELLDTHSEEQIIEWGLEEAVQLSDSLIGFFHFVNEDQNTISLNIWSKETLKICDVPNKKEHYSISEAGTWVDCFYERKPVVHNDYQSLKHKKGLPEGHFPLFRYISLPIIENNKVKIIFGVGNKKSDYNQFDVDALGLFAKNLWMVIQRKRTAYELQESNSAKDKFFSIISHDLRSPIGSVQSVTEVLLENLSTFSNDEIEKYINTINETVKNAYNLLDNILLWAKTHRNKLDIVPQIIDLGEIFNDILKIEIQKADKKQIKLNIHMESKLKVTADYDMLSTVIRNLISNAIKFTHRGGEVFLDSRSYNKSTVVISIMDNGIGIPSEILDKLFKIDESISTKGTANEKGTGLGLVLCKEFVERNGGKIWVESIENEGTKFYFTVPKA